MTLQRRLQLVDCTTEDSWVAAALKVAFATSDMKQVDQHFGAAQSFAVYAVDKDRSCFLEAAEFGEQVMEGGPRNASGMCPGGQSQVHPEGGDPIPDGTPDSGGRESEASAPRRRSHPRDAGPLLSASGRQSEDKLAAKIEVLDGCIAIYCQAVGTSAIQQLKAKSVQPIKVAPGTLISELLASLQEELRQGPSSWLARAIGRTMQADPSRFDEMEEEGWRE